MRNQHITLWRQIPTLRLLLPAILGILLGANFPSQRLMVASGVLVIILLFICMIVHRARSIPILLMVALGMSGYAFTCLQQDAMHDRFHTLSIEELSESVLKVEVVELPKERERTVRFIASVRGVFRDRHWEGANSKLLIYLKKDSASRVLMPGDELLVTGSVRRVPGAMNPGGFDMRAYMASKQVHHQLYARSGEWKRLSTGMGWLTKVRRLQRWALDRMEASSLDHEERAILSALMLGSKDDLSDGQRHAFAAAGAMHVLAVSGLHVGIIYLLLTGLLAPLKRLKNGSLIIAVIAMFVLWGFAILTGLSASVTRAATMFSFVSISGFLRRDSVILNTVIASAFVLLFLDPFILFDLGFQLSYLAVVGIVVLQPRIEGWWRPRTWLVKKIWSIVSVSLAAQLATGPIALHYFHQFPNYFLLTNLIVIPAATVILPAGIAMLFISAWEWGFDLLSKGLGYVISALDASTKWISDLPYAVTKNILLTGVETVLAYLLIAACCAFLILKHHQWLVFSLSCLSLLLAVNASRLWWERQQEQMVFFHLRTGNAMAYVKGTSHRMVADQEVLKDESSIAYTFRPFQTAMGLTEPTSLEVMNGAFQCSDRRVLPIVEEVESTDLRSCDILWVKEKCSIPLDKVLRACTPHLVILGGSLGHRVREEWKTRCVAYRITIHDLNEGAYVERLEGGDIF